VLHHAFDVLGTEPRCHERPLGRRFRVELHAEPFDLEVEFLFQLFDDALADVAEGSDVIGIHLHADGHERDLAFRQLKR
jgi:hypothetical protein